MDLPLHFRVLWRFKLFVVPGLVLALVLAFLSIAKVGPGGIHWRKSETFVSYSTQLVTQRGFPEGRLGLSGLGADVPAQAGAAAGRTAFADPIRLSSLAILYAKLIDGDGVQSLVRKTGPIDGTYEASAVFLPNTTQALPMVSIAAFGPSPKGAMSLARREAAALATYIEQQQAVNEIPAAQRVELKQLKEPTTAALFKGRSKTLPIVIFLAIVFAVCGLAFLLESMRPRVRALAPATSDAA